MSTWGSSSTNRKKPSYLVPGGKFSPDKCFATAAGWVYRHNDGSEELLVTIGGLSTALGGAQITEVYFDKTTYAQGDTAVITVVFTEKVTKVSGTPTLSVTTVSGLAGSPLTFTYASGTGTDKFTFSLDLSTITGVAGETLALVAQTIGSATFSDTAGGSDTVDTAFASGDRYSAAGATTTYANPTVSGATILKACFGAGAYAHTANNVTVKIKWNQTVTVTGVPTVSVIQTSVGAVAAAYTSGSGTDTLTFTVDISAVGVASNSLQLTAQTLVVTGATIKAGLITADLAFASGDRQGANFSGSYADIVLS